MNNKNNRDLIQKLTKEGDEKNMEDILYTVSETAKLLKTNPNYIYELIRRGLLPALKLGSLKIRKTSLIEFLKKYEGQDLTNLSNIKELEILQNEQIK